MSKTVKVEMELPLVEGYEYTGEYRIVQIGEEFLENSNDYGKPSVRKATYVSVAEWPIMRPIVKWRDARPSDLENGPVECRCRDTTRQEWSPATFAAYSAAPSDELRYGMVDDEGELGSWYAYCQVKDNA